MRFRNINIPSPVLFFVLAIFQASLGDYFTVYGVKPSLIAGVVFAVAVSGGEWRGIVYGAMGGLVEDSLSGVYMGLMTSAYALCGYLAGKAGKRLVNVESANLGGIFLFSLAAGVYVSVVLNSFCGGLGVVDRIARFAAPQAAYNAVAGTVLLWLMNRKFRWRRGRGEAAWLHAR